MWLLIDDYRDLLADVIARTPEAAKRILALGGWKGVYFDHDLGFDETGYDILVWAIERQLLPSQVSLVTANLVCRQKMAAALENAGYHSVNGRDFTL